MPSHIIAGIDPGATVGVAVLDLSGKKLASVSILSGGIAEAVSAIERHGTPSLICCDVFPAPEMAQKIASYFSCRLFVPQRGIREAEKREIARGAGVENNHERDAYAAAVMGFRAHANKLRQIDALQDLGHDEKEKIKHLLLKGYRIKDAFASMAGPEPAGEGRVVEKKPAHPEQEATPGEMRERVAALARENAHLRLLAERLEGEKRHLEGRLRLMENGVRQSMLRDTEFRRLKFQLQSALSRLSFRKKAREQSRQDRGGRGKTPQKTQEGGVLNVGEERIDLEKMVAEYRSRRHKGI